MARVRLFGSTATAKNWTWRSKDKNLERALTALIPSYGPSPAYGDPDNELAAIARDELGAEILDLDECDLPETGMLKGEG